MSAKDSYELGKREEKKRVESGRNNLLLHKKFRDDWKQKMLSLDKNTLKIITGRMQIRQGAPTKDDNMEVISAIVKITITGSAGHECRRFEII